MNDGSEKIYTPTYNSGEQLPQDTLIFDSAGSLWDRYTKKSRAEGSSCFLYAVSEKDTNKLYAVKTPNDKDRNEDFINEVSLWIDLPSHPNLVKAYFLEEYDNQPYLFLELIEGEQIADDPSLAQLLYRTSLPPEDAVKYAYQICLGMEYVNRNGETLHGDLKPDNLLITKDGLLKITDFGLAYHLRVSHGQYPRVPPGRGWPSYMPPERFLHMVEDSRSDIYSIGIVFYEMLTGKHPCFDPQLTAKINKIGINTINLPAKWTNRDECRHWFSQFHEQEGADVISKYLYYHGIPSIDMGNLGMIIGSCVTHLPPNRFNSFKELRETLEQNFSFLKPNAQGFSISAYDDLRNRALTLHKIGQYSKALEIYNNLLQNYPEDGQLWVDSAETLFANQQIKTAKSFIEKALKLNPELKEKVSLALAKQLGE